MKMKPFYFLSLLLVLLVSIGVWIQFSPKENPPVVKDKATQPTIQPKKENTVPTTRGKETLQVQQETPTERAQRKREMMIDFNKRLAPEGDPYTQELLRAMQSPAYEEFVKRPFSRKRWFDFLESQGIKSYRNESERHFHRYKPGVTLEAYEVIMKQELAEMFLQAEPIDETNRAVSHEHTIQVFNELKRREPANLLWKRAYFQELDEDGSGDVWFQWADNVRKNAASIVANVSAPDTRTESIETFSTGSTEPVEEDIFPQTLPTNMRSPEDITKQMTQNVTDVETKKTEQIFADIPNGSPTEADFERMLRQRVSPQRFNTAMQTLRQYGPQEGLRRIKESDPEVATHLERLIQPEKDND